MSLANRLRRLEQHHGAIQWCRCPYDAERHRAEDRAAMDSGEPTPSRCDRCGDARIAVQYVPMEQLAQLRPWSEREK